MLNEFLRTELLVGREAMQLSLIHIYSRITGDYRPVQNWNAGKTQEYKNRRTYIMEQSHLRRSSVAGNYVTIGAKPVQAARVENPKARKYLFTTKTCPNCRIAKEFLKEEDYILIDAEEEQDLVEKYGIRQAPTFVVDDGQSPKIYVNASNIRRYVEKE